MAVIALVQTALWLASSSASGMYFFPVLLLLVFPAPCDPCICVSLSIYILPLVVVPPSVSCVPFFRVKAISLPVAVKQNPT